MLERRTLQQGFTTVLIIIVLLVAAGLSAYFFTQNKDMASSVVSPNKNAQPGLAEGLLNSSNSGKIIPFEELTIPFLRNRSYTSQLGERELLSQSGSYSRYLTSYDSDGLQINGLLTIPKGEEPEGGWPAVVFIHGYIPPTLYETTERYAAYIDNLARNGFVVFKIDLRGHGQSEGEASGAYYSGDYIIDTLNAIAALQSTDFVDRDEIGLWGHSMAGNVILRSIAVHPDIQAAVIWGGAVYTYQDLQEYGIDDNSYRPPTQTSERNRRREELFGAHGQFTSDSDFWKKVAPTNYLTDIQTPIQLHHAVNDEVVSIEYTRNLQRLLDNSSIEYQVFEYPTGGHDIEGSSFNLAMQRTVDFYKKHLSNIP